MDKPIKEEMGILHIILETFLSYLVSPHGGDISPSEISNRTYGVSVTDSNTIELGIAIRNYFYSNYNIRPYVIINNLKRTKLDANRDRIEAAQGNIYAERAFDEFHFYIEKAREDIITKFGTGVLFDIHGHGINPDGFNDLRTWIGYLLTSDELDNSNDYIDKNISINDVSISVSYTHLTLPTSR